MPTFTFTSPEGKSYTVNGPDGATKEQAFQMLQQQIGAESSPQEPAQPVDQIDYQGPDLAVNSMIGLLPEDQKLEGRTRQQVASQRADRKELEEADGITGVLARALQGGIDGAGNFARGTIVGSFLDEGVAKVKGAFHDATGIGETEREALARIRAQNRIQDEDHTGAATVSKLAGALLTGAPFLRGSETALGTVMRGAGAGTLYGGLYGAGEGETSEERIDKAKSGAQLGAVFGAAIPVAATVSTRAAAPVIDMLRPIADRMKRNPDDAALAILGRKISEAGTTPRELASDIQNMSKRDTRLDSNSYVGYVPGSGKTFGNNLETLADSNDGMRRLAGSVYRTGGPGAQRIRDTLDGRQIGPKNRFAGQQPGEFPGQARVVEDAVERSMAIKGQKGAFQTERGLVEAQKVQGRKLYKEAFESSQSFKITTEIEEVRAYARTQPAPVAKKLDRAISLFERNGTPVKTLQQFDDSKKALDDLIAKARSKPNLQRQLVEIKNGLLKKVHAPNAKGEPTRNVKYQQARDAWGSGAERREALDLGRNALKADSEMSVSQFRALTPGQQSLFRIGLRQAVKRAQGTKRPGSDVTQLFAQQRVQELMSEVIPRTAGKGVFSNRPDRFGNFLEREGRKVATRNSVLGGSPTAQRQGDDAELAGDTLGELFGRFRQSPSLANMALEAMSSGARKIFGFRKEVGDALARRLMETDPVERMKILREIQRATKPDQFGAFIQQIDDLALRGAQAGTRTAISDE